MAGAIAQRAGTLYFDLARAMKSLAVVLCQDLYCLTGRTWYPELQVV